ncbi:protein kinase domain-containing protein [Planctomicrobium piriforme]|uniref:Serine/threonine protein kinase n=1 Tax=Planctomicrobium piriforme TaxID=1576369 RepID=A0A1I3GQR1_9PLAN|nr:HDOD domain-containing protein [Planctomicrobium piriforme]SFI25828.1 serine/threonine protein kinase [Planctomicrobium piriforme]
MTSVTTGNSNEQQLLTRLRNLQWSGESQLPLPPQSVIDFSARARQPDVTVRELSEVVECEPALTAELLRNVNSCVRGLRQKVDSVQQAIALLGIPNSTTILLTSALSNAVQRVESPLVPAADFRRETVERAIFAREVARHMGLNATVAYTAAMLQDILLPVLTRRHQVDYHEYLHQGEYESLAAFEKLRFGWTHAEITAKTLLNWGFSNTLALAVLQHHDSPEQLLVDHDELPLGFAVSCSALLMDVLRQSPDGVTRLVDLHAINQRFHVMEIATFVDQSVKELSNTLHNPVSLVHRLQNAMLNQLDQRRRQVVITGRQFGSYVLEEKMKESSMGAIFKARHIHLRRPAAVKILRADRTTSASIAQFEQEVQLTSRLNHPNTVRIFDFGRTPDDLFFYAMELVDGMTLADLVKTHGRLSDGRVLNLLQQTCGSLAEAHDLNLIHRDIKPENIMISLRANRPDHVTLLDFGLVTSSAGEQTSGNESVRGVVGTPLYMSPEAAQGRENICSRSDLYSIAAVGYFLLTGTPVFTGNSVMDVLQQHMRSTPIPPTERADVRVAPELERILMRCLQKDPVDRPRSALELVEALSQIVPVNPWKTEDGLRWWRDQSQLKEDQAASAVENPLASTMVTPNNASSSSGLERTLHV